MPVVSIPEKDIVIKFPDNMSPKEIENEIYTRVYGQSILTQGQEPSGIEKAKQFVGDLFRREGPRVGPLTEEDRAAFEPAVPTLKPKAKPTPEIAAPGLTPEDIEDLRDETGEPGGFAGRNLPSPETTQKYLSYAPYIAVKALHGFMGPVLPALKSLGVDTGGLLQTATEYWRKQVGESVEIPNVGIGRDEEGNLRIEPREPIPFADLLGATSEITGAVAGPVRAALGAGGLVAEKLSRYARPFYRSIVRGMVGGALLGEGKKDETLENMALFGVFEPLAYGIGSIPDLAQKIKGTNAWRTMTIKQRGLVLQNANEAMKGWKAEGISNQEILRNLSRLKPQDPKAAELHRELWDELAVKTGRVRAAEREVSEREAPGRAETFEAEAAPPVTAIKPGEAIPRPKEPWEMTFKEYGPFFSEQYKEAGRKGAPPLKSMLDEHEKIVRQALSEGKPVPGSVLKDYPELKPKAPPLKLKAAEPEPKEPEGIEEADETIDIEMAAPGFTRSLTLKINKENFTKALDQAIKKAPEETEEAPGYIQFKFGAATYNIFNRKAELQAFKKRISTLSATTKTAPIKKPSTPKPSAFKKEAIGGLYPIKGVTKWFTDGSLLVKGSPPKGAKLAEDAGEAKLTWDFIKGKTFGNPGEKANFKYFATEDGRALDVGVSKEPLPRLAEGTKDIGVFAVFKSGGKYFAFDQRKFNVIRNRFPDATYKMSKDTLTLIAYDKGEPVAALAKLTGRFEEETPGLELARETGYSNVGRYTTGQDYANIGQYATNIKNILKMPEIVRLAKGLLGGRYPKIREILSKRMASGIFRPKDKGDIFLKAELFKDPDQAAAVLAHEIGHLVDWLPDKDLKRGNILGRIATLKKFVQRTLPRAPGESGILTEKDRRRLRQLAIKLLKEETANKWIDEVIRRELPISPTDVLAIWNAVEQAKLINPGLYEYIARLSTPEKKSIVKDALKDQVPEQLKKFAKVVTEPTGKRIKVEITKSMIHKKYIELLNREIEKRRAFSRDEIMDELKALSRAWKPFDPALDPVYTAYRYKSGELYADAFSALINAPGFLKATAPKFYEAFFNYIEEKPQVKALYDKIQDDIASGAVEKQRVENLFDMFRSGDGAYAKSLKTRTKFWDQVAREFIDANWMLLKKVKKVGERNIPAGENPRYKLEELAYSGSEAELYLTTVFRNVVKPLEKQNITWDQFGEYLYHLRVSTERAEIANPQGWTPQLSKERIREIKEALSPEQAEALEDAREAFRNLREENIIAKAEDAGIYADELIKLFKDSKNYATFDVVAYIRKRYGKGPGGKIYRQIGTLNEISNPATATIMKDITLIKSINKQLAVRSVANLLKNNFPKEIRPAEKKWNGRIYAIQKPPEGEGMLAYLDKGKAIGYYVDRDIAEIFEHNPMESHVIARILGTTIQPFRLAFTELNYGFWMFNLHRDYFRASQMLPKAKISTFLPSYLKGIKPAFKSVFGIPDAVVQEMQRGNMLISIADVRGLRPEDKQIERLLKMYHLQPGQWESRITRPFGKMFTYFTNIGRAFERTTKVGSYQYLKKKFPEMTTEQVGHIVRVMGGSPDFLRLGRGYPIYNNILMFSNAMKEGYRGDFEAAARKPSEFMWKKFKYAYFPKLLMFAISMGLLGRDSQEVMEGASEYDKTNYIIVPLGLSESGKSVYLRVPLDESSRLMGGVLWKALNHQDLGWGDLTTGMFDYMAGQAPTIHPGIDALISVIQYASGLNPYDHFRGRYAIPEQVFEAGGERAHKAFAKWLANKSGASLVYRFQYDDVGRIKSELEKVIGYPILSNIVGRFVKVSDQGLREGLRIAKKEVRSGNMRDLLDAKDALNKWIRGETLSNEDVQAILKKPDIIDRNIMVGLARKYGHVYLEEFITAVSNAEKAAILNKLLEKQMLENE